MLLFPVAASETVEQDRKYFLINKRSAVVWSTLTVGECQRFISGIKMDRKKSRFRYDALRYKGIYEKAVAGYPYGQESLQAPRMRDLPI